MADKVFTMTISTISPSKSGDIVTITNGGDGGTSVIVTIGEGLTPPQAEERIRAFLRSWRRARSKVTTIAGIPEGATFE